MLFEYLFMHTLNKISLEHILECSPLWVKEYPNIYYAGFTQYWKQSAAPKNYKQPHRYKTERWYAYTEKEQNNGALEEILYLLTHPPFASSIGDRGEEILPIPLPIKRPVGRPRKIIIPLRQIVVCKDLQLIAKLPGEII